MNKQDRIYAVIGLIIPWITLILLIGLSTYYCDLLWIRAVCIIAAVLNGAVTLRLARSTLRAASRNR